MEFKELLKAAADGDEQALGVLYRMYQPLITKMSMLNDEFDEDLHQEQMICFWRCVKKFYKIFLDLVTIQSNPIVSNRQKG